MENLGKLILRLSFGAFMIPHGYSKALNLFGGGEIHFADPFGLGEVFSLALAVFAELICSIALILGFKTRLASVPLMVTMLVAALMIHADDPWGKQEFPLLYFFGYLTIALIGAGKYSLDSYIGTKKLG
jgi:putative oxidoreductase